jgi:deazaflavin-dependent oxidoreductase (nitroreductase family)
VLLKHIGRKSGEVRKTVVEVVEHDKATDTYFIVSGWGYKANWYRNLQATPDIEIKVGRRTLQVTAETIPANEGVNVLLSYREKYPLAARELSQLMGLDIFKTTPAELENIIQESLPVVALRPRQ